MLRLFSSIRQQLLNENKTVRYLKYAVGEFLLIVTGILVALQIQNWNEGRKDRIQEVEAVSSLIVDLETQLNRVSNSISLADRKVQCLLRVEQVLIEGSIADPRSFLGDVTAGSFFGWNQGDIIRSAYDDLIGSGKFDTIRDPEIRTQISDYFKQSANGQDRMKGRRTNYPTLTYQLIPRGDPGNLSDIHIRSGLTDGQIANITKAVIDSDIRNYITAEQNLGLFVGKFWQLTERRANELKVVLEEYKKEIQR